MTELVNALRGNTVLREINWWDNEAVTDESMDVLAAVLPQTAVEFAEMASSDREAEMNALCEANIVRNQSIEASIATSRPYQRLLLAAVYQASHVHLSEDLLLSVANCLSKSAQCPLTRAGEALPSHSEAFAWHAVGDAADPADVVGSAAAGESEKPSKRPRREGGKGV